MICASLMLALLECSALIEPGAVTEIDAAWLNRAKAEARPAYERYGAVSKQLEETAESRYEKDASIPGAKFRNRTLRITTCLLNNNRLFEQVTTFDDEKDKPIIRLSCANEEYGFDLQKQRIDSPYVLVKYSPVGPGHTMTTVGLSSYAFGELRSVLNAVEGQEQHVAKTIRWDEPRQLLYVRLEAKRGNKSKAVMADEEVWLDPSENWRVVEVKIGTPSTNNRFLVTYGQPIDGLAFPVEITETASSQGKSPGPSFHIHTTLKVSKTNKSPRDFRLSAFGLPEPVEFRRQDGRVPSYVWILAFAAACAVLSISFRYWAHKRRLRPAA